MVTIDNAPSYRSPDLNLTPLAAFLHFCRVQRGSDRNLPLFVRWVRHKNVSHPNHSMSSTILSTCYASTESLGVSELNDTNIKYFGVPRRISRALESTNFTTIVFTLPHIMAPKFANQLPIRNVGRTCNSGNVWNWESQSRCTEALENTAPHKIRCDNLFFNFAAWRICNACNLRRNHPEKRRWVAKPTHQSIWFADLRIRVYNFRNCYANEVDHMTKSDLKSKIKIAAVIMKWRSQGIPFICWNVGTYKYFWIPRSSHE